MNQAYRMNASAQNSRLGYVSTIKEFVAPPTVVWQALLFYEEVTLAPPFFLRWLLPVPQGTTGCKAIVGGEVTCSYLRGYLIKRVTAVVQRRRYAFEVTEQNLALRGIRLIGGEYNLQAVAPARTRVTLSTRYASPYRPTWLCAPLETAVCHSFHRHLLRAMRQNLIADLADAPAA